MDWRIIVVIMIVAYIAYVVRDIESYLKKTTEVKTKRDLALVKEIESIKHEIENLKKRY